MKKEWFNDSEFWEVYAPIMFDDAHWAEVGAVADFLTGTIDLYREARPGEKPDAASEVPRCLDQCCGFGRISLEMARRGFAVSGVDITKTYLETARDDAAYENLDIEFIENDVRSFCRKDFFDLVYNVYISFGYFEDPLDDALLVRNAYDSLKPGGSFVVETLGKEIAVRDFTAADWFERAGYFVLTQYESLDSWASLKNRWILINREEKNGRPQGSIIEKTFIQRLYSAAELRKLFADSGFGGIQVAGGWNGEAYDKDARTCIVTGRKELPR